MALRAGAGLIDTSYWGAAAGANSIIACGGTAWGTTGCTGDCAAGNIGFSWGTAGCTRSAADCMGGTAGCVKGNAGCPVVHPAGCTTIGRTGGRVISTVGRGNTPIRTCEWVWLSTCNEHEIAMGWLLEFIAYAYRYAYTPSTCSSSYVLCWCIALVFLLYAFTL